MNVSVCIGVKLQSLLEILFKGVEGVALCAALIVDAMTRVEDLNNEFEITLTIFEGSSMLLDVDMDGDALPQFDIGSPAMYSLGFVAEGTRTDLEDGSDLNSGSTVWVLPGLEILQPGYILSVEAYVKTPGLVNLLILKPICAGGGDVYCPHNNECVTESSCNYVFDYPSNPEYTEYCDANGIYCALSGTCEDPDNTPECTVKNNRYDEASPRNDYEVVASIPVTFTKTNAYEYVKIPIAGIKAGVVAEIGYIIGYETTLAGIGWQNVTNNTIEYQYSAVPHGVGSTLAKSDATAFEIQHYIRVTTVKELQTLITYTFPTYGDHPITVNVTNDLGSEQKTCTVTIQQNITDLLLTMDNHTEVRSTEEATLFVWLQRGIPALLSIDWGDGSPTEEVDRNSTSPDVPDNITHLFNASGNMTVKVNASNLWNWEVFELEITVYNPVDLDAYEITTNSPQPNGLRDVKGVITIVTSYTNGAVKPATFADVTITGGYAFDEVLKDKIYDITSVGDSCTLKIEFTYPGVYLLTLKFENPINSEEYEVEVEILDIIYGFEVTPRHIPVEEQFRSPEDGTFIDGVWYMPIEVPVLFTATVEQGNDIAYTYEDFGDGSVAVSTREEVYSHKYSSYTQALKPVTHCAPAVSG
ncbi:uncharacterized protein LOC117104085 [Anneissia japonica]|uniref:uncharacterized protein LOC117104085 n=1 Tax=Anneissia japonica TaxID=1529436 RepID=UPI00142578CD|nr:uncharacterized protein LOC117104085 [Anneissia japonica]